MTFRIIASLIPLLFSLHLEAQYLFQHFNADKGLSSNEVLCVLQDRTGFLWIGTRNGLNRFDGSECLPFFHNNNDSTSISDNIIRCLYEDKKGMIWAGTRDGGVSILDPRTLGFTSFRHTEKDTTSLADNFINIIFEDRQDQIWIACHSKGISRFDPVTQHFIHYHPGASFPTIPPRLLADILCFAMDPTDEHLIWFGSQQGLLSFHTQTYQWNHYPFDRAHAENPQLYAGLEGVIRYLQFDNQGMLWAGTWGGGLARFNPSTGIYKLFKYESLNPVNGFRNNVMQLVKKSEQEFWFVAPHKGIGVFHVPNGSFHFITDPSGAGDIIPDPYQILIDPEGFMFVPSLSDGLYYTNIMAHQFSKIEIPFRIIDVSLSKDGSQLYGSCMGTPGKLLHYDLREKKYQAIGYQPVMDISENHFSAVIPTREKIWLIENNSLYYFDPVNDKILPYLAFNPASYPLKGQHPHHFLTGLVDKHNRLWMGTKYSGLFVLDLATNITTTYYADPITDKNIFEDWILSLFEDQDGNVWYGTVNFGYFSSATSDFIHLSKEKDFPDADITIKKISAITQTPDNMIWIGTSVDGIAVINVQGKKPRFVKSFSQKNGLASNSISGLIADQHGNIWASTVRGLSRISKEGIIDNFDAFSGITPILCMEMGSDGNLYLGTEGGFYHFDPAHIQSQTYSAIPYIESFQVYDQEKSSDIRRNPEKPMHLNYDQDFISISYGAIAYFQPDEIRYFYMLEGLSDQWQDAGNRKFVSFTNLKGGDYTFRLKTNRSGETRVLFHIDTPYWETWWFYVLLALLSFALIIGVFWYRLSQIRKQEKIKASFNEQINMLEMKALRAQMNPHFLFNSLNSIRYYILKNETKNASDYITKFSRLLRLILKNSRQNLISLTDELQALKIYVEFEQMRFSKKFDLLFLKEDDVNTDGIMIQPMTIQPFVENAIWHGLMPKEEEGLLKIEVKRNLNHLYVIVEDNGIGREKAMELKASELTEAKSYGMKITEDRMKLSKSAGGKGSEFEILDLYDEHRKPLGTRVVITFEL